MNEITRIQKLISAARSWIGSKAPHDQHQATAALSRARALCAKHGISEAQFHWPDQPPSAHKINGLRPDRLIIDDPWADDPLWGDIPIKTAEDVLNEYLAQKRRQESIRRFADVLRRQGFTVNHASDAFRHFAEALKEAEKGKEKP